MKKQNYLSEFTARFSQLAATEEVMNTQKELCKALFFDYLQEPISPKGTDLLRTWSNEMKKYNMYCDLYIEMTREFWGFKKSFIS